MGTFPPPHLITLLVYKVTSNTIQSLHQRVSNHIFYRNVVISFIWSSLIFTSSALISHNLGLKTSLFPRITTSLQSANRDLLISCTLPSYLIICDSADPSHLDDMSSEQVSGQSRRADNRSVMTGGIQTQGLGEGSEGKEYRTADSRAHGHRGGCPQITRLCNHRASNVQTYYEQLIGHTKLDEDDRQYTTSLHGNIHFANRITCEVWRSTCLNV